MTLSPLSLQEHLCYNKAAARLRQAQKFTEGDSCLKNNALEIVR